MKKIAILAAALMISAATYAQKDEMKALKRIYDKEKLSDKDIADYKANVAKLANYMGSASEADKVYMEYYRVQVPSLEFNLKMQDPANQPQAGMLFMKSFNLNTIADIAQAYNKVLEYEKKSGKKVFTDDINEEFQAIMPMLNAYVTALDQQKNYKDLAKLFHSVYLLNPENQDMLYNAATYAVAGSDYDLALNYYDQLKKLNYSGERTVYIATNTASDQEESFATKAERDKLLALKSHVGAREEKIPSKRGEIYKNIALILVEKGKIDEAKAAIAEAKRENPSDSSLLLTEADLYLKLGDNDTYKKLITEVIAQNPNDADLVYNLGVINMQQENMAEAEKYFKRAVEVDPKYVNAYVNLSVIKLRGDQKIVDEMNKLGSSEKDNKRYAALKKERDALYREALPMLEKAYAVDPKNDAVQNNLMSVYGYLEMTDKYNELKKLRK